MFGNVAPVVGTQHKSLNVSKCVVRNWELARTDPVEHKENIPSIIDVQRIVVKRNNVEVKTNTLILTFNSPKIHESLNVCYLNIPVSQFVDAYFTVKTNKGKSKESSTMTNVKISN